MKKKLIKFLPPEIANVKDFKEIMNTETIELELIENKQKQLFYENFIDTSTEQGIKYQEKIFKIKADLENETLKLRKLRIKTKKMDRLPITQRAIEHKLEMLFGISNYNVLIENEKYTITIDIKSFDYKTFNMVIDNIKYIIPCNMILKATLICENNTNLNIRTKFKVYPYQLNMCGTFQCGTIPEYSNQGVTIQETLNLNSNNNNNWPQKYKLCGGKQI